MTSQSEPKWLQKCFQKPSKIDQKTKPKNNTKNSRIWLPKWLQKPSKSEMGSTIFVSKNAFQIQLRFFIVFGAVLPPPGLPLASLLAPFGCLWAPFWRLLAPFGFLWAPLELSLALLSTSSPADSSGTSFLAPFGCLWAPFWRLRAPFWAAFRHRTCCKKRPAFRHWQHSVTGLKWYILSKRLGDSSGTSCQNA